MDVLTGKSLMTKMVTKDSNNFPALRNLIEKRKELASKLYGLRKPNAPAPTIKNKFPTDEVEVFSTEEEMCPSKSDKLSEMKVEDEY